MLSKTYFSRPLTLDHAIASSCRFPLTVIRADLTGNLFKLAQRSTKAHMDTERKSNQVLVDDKNYSVLSVRNGGMGRVWFLEQSFNDVSFDPIYRRRIAVKTFDFMSEESAIANELNVWISLDHRSVLPLKKIGRLNYRLAAIMPLLNGSLDDVLEDRRSLSEQEIVQILLDVVEGLDNAWSSFKIFHLDLKPSNILVVNTGSPIQIKIADWGIARLTAETLKIRRLNANAPAIAVFDAKTAYAAGTPLFMSPERFSGNWVLSPTADIYSLGMMAVQLKTGTLPFRFGQVNPAEEIATGAYFDNAAQILDNASENFRLLVLQCIHPEASVRPQTFKEMAVQLNSISKYGKKK